MKVYLGQTRSKSLIERLASWGFGEMTNRGEAPPRRTPFALDNGAYKDFTNKKSFEESAFLRDLEIASWLSPDFVVCPDRVAGGLDSLAFSLSWAPRLRGLPLYLAVQNGMVAADIEPHLALFTGLFVGGDLPWKIATGKQWVEFAHSKNKKCHIGRVGTAKRVAWALRIKADSIDSCLPLWSEGNLQTFLFALQQKQGSLF